MAAVWLSSVSLAQACTVCRPKVEAGIYNQAYTANAALVLLPVLLLVGASLLLYFSPALPLWKMPPPLPSTGPR